VGRKQQQILYIFTEDEAMELCIFHTALNNHDEYEILDGSWEKMVDLPAIPHNM
jgi:hypothetical protein